MSRTTLTALASLTLAIGCVPPLPEGHYACEVAATDCPSGWSCLGGRCYAGPSLAADGGMPLGDAAITSASDAAAMGDAGLPPVDAATDDAASAPDASAPDATVVLDAGTARPVAIGLAVGARHACATDVDGVVSCWGDNATGALGTSPTATPSSAFPRVVSGAPVAHEICAGAGFTCALAVDGHVACWGANDLWQLGRGGASSAVGDVPGVSGATHIACGAGHVCVTTASGVTCWGNNASAQTGLAATGRELPHAVAGVVAVALSAGASHTCALAASGAVSCWGGSTMGQLGPRGPAPSSTARSASPVVIDGLDALAIASGSEHTCAAQRDGEVVCWGRADAGRLGMIGTGAHPALSSVAGVSSTLLVAGGSEVSCAASSDPAMFLACWGSAAYGQLGTGGSLRTGVEPMPLPVSSAPAPITGVAAGNGFACATSDTSVMCWGLNDRGQLGDGSTTTRTAPVTALLP